MSALLSMCGGGYWGVEIGEEEGSERKAERSCKSEERVENCTIKVKNEWKINGNRVLVSTQISQFWDTDAGGHTLPLCVMACVFQWQEPHRGQRA